MAEDQDLVVDESDRAAGSGPPPQPRPPGDGVFSNPVSRRAFLTGAVAGGAAGVAIAAGGITVVQQVQQAQEPAPAVAPGAARPVGGRPGEPAEFHLVTLKVNGKEHELYVTANRTLLEVLRQDLGLTGTKLGCNFSECSACTVLVEGVAVNSCSALAVREAGKEILTIEGLEQDGKLHPVQEAFMEHMGFQCGFCTPGQIMRTVGLLKKHPNPSDDVIKRDLSGNLCKCAAYPFILAAVKTAAKNVRSV